jgi:rsbT co-antagonist protein RsbR
MVTNEITDDCIYTGLFGTLDSARMNLVGAKITKLCEEKEISIAIIDLGNVDAIDTAVAGYLNGLGATLKFGGVTPIMCGITSDLANTMVKAGVTLDSMLIVRNLKQAIQESYHLTGYALIKNEQ